MITKREAAIISAYTGMMLGKFSDTHEFIEEIMGRPVFTHEIPRLYPQIQEKSKPFFIALDVEK